MCLRVDPSCCSRDGAMEEVAVFVLNVEAVCFWTTLPNVILANEGRREVDAMLVGDVGGHPIVPINIC